MEDSLISEAEKSEGVLSQLIGPGWKERWMYWSSRTTEQVKYCHFEFLNEQALA